MQDKRSDRLALHDQRETYAGASAGPKQRVAMDKSRSERNVVGDHRFAAAKRPSYNALAQHRGLVGRSTQRLVRLLVDASRGDPADVLRTCVQDTDSGRVKPTDISGDAAHFFEQLRPVPDSYQ